MLENVRPLEIKRYLGLNSRQTRSELTPGFSPSSGHFYNMDLSVPGRARVRGGSVAFVDLSGDVPTRLFNYYNCVARTNSMLVSAGTKLYEVDTAGNASTIATGFTDGWVGDFLNYGSEAFIAGDSPKIYNGTTVRKWGIAGPAAANTYGADSGTGLTGTYQYKYTYVNSVSGHESNASEASLARTVSNKTINLTGITASVDPQVDKINLYRTTAGGAIYFYLGQIDNGTTTYADSISDTLLGITEAPLFNDPAPDFVGIEEWDGRIWGFQFKSTKVQFSNDGYYTPTGNGNPWEAFAIYNEIDFKAEVLGIKKSPNFNELWVHTVAGLYAVVQTYIPQDPYQAVVRNASWHSVNHFSIVNIYNQQWFLGEEGKVMSIDSAGNVGYESYYIEPDLGGGNTPMYAQKVQAAHYRGNQKNQYRLSFPLGGLTDCTRMLAANYLQRTPPDFELGRSFPVWEYHKINSSCLGVCKDSNGFEQLYTGWTDGKIYRQDHGTNDAGSAIPWSHSLGWIRAYDTAEKTALARRVIQYYNPLGTWTWSLTTSFDFGNSGGQVYSVSAPPVGALLDEDFYLDESMLAPEDPFVKIETDIYGAYSFVELIWSGNVLDQIMEMHTVVLMPVQIEGFRGTN